MTMRYYTKPEVVRIFSMVKEGVPLKIIAHQFGRTHGGIRELINRERAKVDPTIGRRPPALLNITVGLHSDTFAAVERVARDAGKFKATWVRELIEREVGRDKTTATGIRRPSDTLPAAEAHPGVAGRR